MSCRSHQLETMSSLITAKISVIWTIDTKHFALQNVKCNNYSWKNTFLSTTIFISTVCFFLNNVGVKNNLAQSIFCCLFVAFSSVNLQ